MNSLKYQKGLSLMELMIALGLGVFLLLALAGIFINANNAGKRRSTSENLDETARQVMGRLEYDLYNAGYVDPFSAADVAMSAFDVNHPEVTAMYFRQAANLPANLNEATILGRVTKGAMIPLLGCNTNQYSDALPSVNSLANCRNNAYSQQQSLQVSYQSFAPTNLRNEVNNARSLALREQEQDESFSGAGVDCTGNKLSNANGFVINRYFLQRRNGINTFGCVSNESGWQPIANGVEEMTFRYLVTPPDETPKDAEIDIKKIRSGLSVVNYLPANMMEDLKNTRLQWAGVVGVEVCLIIAVEPTDGSKEGTMSTTLPNVPTCEKQDHDATRGDAPFKQDIPRSNPRDTRFYKRYVQTISLPNSLYLTLN